MADSVVESAPADENDDSWLYGESANDQKEDQAPGVSEKVPQQTDASVRDFFFKNKLPNLALECLKYVCVLRRKV